MHQSIRATHLVTMGTMRKTTDALSSTATAHPIHSLFGEFADFAVIGRAALRLLAPKAEFRLTPPLRTLVEIQ